MNISPVPYQLIGATGGFYDTAGVIPKPATGTGTVAALISTKTVTGTGTLFLTELNIGDYLYFPTTKQFGKVVDIFSNTGLFLETALTAAVVAGEVVKVTIPRFKRVKFTNTGATAVTINGISYAAAASEDFPGQAYGLQGGVVPIIKYDAAASAITIITE